MYQTLCNDLHYLLFEKELFLMSNTKVEPKKQTESVADLYEIMDMETYADSFDSINRNKPILADTVIKLVGKGQRPEEIKAHYMRRFPTSFIQAQKIYEAARYVDFMGKDL